MSSRMKGRRGLGIGESGILRTNLDRAFSVKMLMNFMVCSAMELLQTGSMLYRNEARYMY